MEESICRSHPEAVYGPGTTCSIPLAKCTKTSFLRNLEQKRELANRQKIDDAGNTGGEKHPTTAHVEDGECQKATWKTLVTLDVRNAFNTAS